MYNMQIQDMDTYMYLCIHICTHYVYYMGVPGGSDGKESPCNAGDLSLIPGPGRYSRERNGYPLHYSYLKIPWTEEPGRLQSMGDPQSSPKSRSPSRGTPRFSGTPSSEPFLPS